MKNNINISTERLSLKPLNRSYLSDKYLSWINDEEVVKFLETQKGSSITDLEKFLLNIENNEIFAWAIEIKNSNQHIGNIKIDPIDYKNGFCEYGILMGEKAQWGKGFAKEASIGVINFCFEKLKLRKVNLGVLIENKRAIKLYNSLGFIKEGLFKKHKVFENGFCDEMRMTIFKKTFSV